MNARNEFTVETIPPREPQSLTHRETILREATDAITVDRNLDYGDPYTDFARIGRLWTVQFGHVFRPEDVAQAMILMKVARLAHNSTHRDSWVDIAGYAGCGFEVAGYHND